MKHTDNDKFKSIVAKELLATAKMLMADAKSDLSDMSMLESRLTSKLDKSLQSQDKYLPKLSPTEKKKTVGDLVEQLHSIAMKEEVSDETEVEDEGRHASVKTAGETASKDDKYGKKDEPWSGTINYNGTRGTVSNAIFELKNGRIVWTDGTWHSGTWAYGLWKDGLWESGTWQMGEWENGIWMSGTWMYGTWHYGVWKQVIDKKSTWMNGTWKNGIWENGTHSAGWWEKGIWQNGIWDDGTFWTGTWQDGTWNNGLNWYGEFRGGTWNRGQWNEGTWKGGAWKGGFDKQKNWHPEDASPNKWKSDKK